MIIPQYFCCGIAQYQLAHWDTNQMESKVHRKCQQLRYRMKREQQLQLFKRTRELLVLTQYPLKPSFNSSFDKAEMRLHLQALTANGIPECDALSIQEFEDWKGSICCQLTEEQILKIIAKAQGAKHDKNGEQFISHVLFLCGNWMADSQASCLPLVDFCLSLLDRDISNVINSRSIMCLCNCTHELIGRGAIEMVLGCTKVDETASQHTALLILNILRINGEVYSLWSICAFLQKSVTKSSGEVIVEDCLFIVELLIRTHRRIIKEELQGILQFYMQNGNQHDKLQTKEARLKLIKSLYWQGPNDNSHQKNEETERAYMTKDALRSAYRYCKQILSEDNSLDCLAWDAIESLIRRVGTQLKEEMLEWAKEVSEKDQRGLILHIREGRIEMWRLIDMLKKYSDQQFLCAVLLRQIQQVREHFIMEGDLKTSLCEECLYIIDFMPHYSEEVRELALSCIDSRHILHRTQLIGSPE